MTSTSGFFEHIKNTLGNNIVIIMKQILNISRKLASYNNRKIFLLQCRMKDIIPNHIINNIKCIYSIQTEEHEFKNKASKILYKFRKAVLNLEIKITITKIKKLEHELKQLLEQLKTDVDNNILVNFKRHMNARYETIFINIKNDNLKKMRELENKCAKMDIKLCDKFLYNYTNEIIPIEAKRLLSAGPNMSIPLTKKEVSIPNIIKDIEYNISIANLNDETKTIVRSRSVNIITNFYNNTNQTGRHNRLIRDYNIAKNFIKENKEICILKSDKGNSTVVMYKKDYIEAMNELLNDKNMYVVIDRDPTRMFQNRAGHIIDKLYNNTFITSAQRLTMKKSNTVAPKLYGMRKTHKPNLAMRPVVSCINSPTYTIAKFVHETLLPYINTFEYNVKNSEEFVRIIRNVRLPSDYSLISLDVVSLFTNIPKDLVLYIIKDEWQTISQYTEISLDILTELINFIFDSSYFRFNNKIYRQLDGSAMGNPASPTIANIVMNYLIKNTLRQLDFDIPFLSLYVDDSAMAVPKDKIDNVVTCFNSFNEKLQFTVEIEENGRLPFLDICMIRSSDNSVATDWYTKPTSSGRVLNFLSNSPIQQKRNIIVNMLNKIYSNCSEQFIQGNIDKMKNMLRNNNYPVFFINKIINEYNNNINNDYNSNVSNDGNVKYMKLPYIPQISYKLKDVFMSVNNNIKIVFYNTKKVQNLFTKLKEAEQKSMHSNIVYKINCKGCNASYIGQTRQYLKNRIYQHKYDCRNYNSSNNNKTALTQHFLDNDGHSFDFEAAIILDHESNWLKRNLSEMIQIQVHPNNINYRTDTQQLSAIYKALLIKYRDVRGVR